MKLLLVGSGGREHALVWKLKQSAKVDKIFCAPGNAGIAEQAECLPVKGEDIEGLLKVAKEKKVDLTVVGPEAPLTLGIVDRFSAAGLRVFGPSQAAARIEGSKAFMKDLMKKYRIPSAAFATFDSPEKAKAYLKKVGAPIVVKADGLAAGKGVILCQTLPEAEAAIDQIMVKKEFGPAGDKVVIEEFLTGEEASFLAFTDGEAVLPLASCQDHKAIFDNDQGPNTGGMGAYSPAPVVTPQIYQQIIDQVMVPTVRAMKAEGAPYRGVLYAGLMIGKGGVKVLEFNARFGDPETQPLLFRMKSDLLPLLEASADGSLKGMKIEWHDQPAVCVVMASKGYPGSYEKGFPITGLPEANALPDTFVFHAGTALKDGKVVTAGGRVLGVTARGKDIKAAIDRTYQAVKKIRWDGAYYRTDIGRKALVRKRV
ncbi:MAG: phosphoribosylamine--glycine ligase [Deltaproteobacteria bacterium RBG_13_61_14]|nr:MAG: phosphoribosylamine--glycine ligase [Deltaproteobacteria bacterium RBG_13_61_14]